MDHQLQEVMCLLDMEKPMKNITNNKSEYPAVTISVGKVKGADAMKISDKILEKVEDLKKNLIHK